MTTKCTSIGSRIVPLVSAVVLSSTPALLASGCSSKGANTEKASTIEAGSLRLDLSAVSTTGRVYRLRQGVFSIVGRDRGVSTTVSTESAPNQASLLVELAPDTYDVFLEPGYELELVEDFGLAFRIRNGTAGTGRSRSTARAGEPDAGSVEVPPPEVGGAGGSASTGGSAGQGMGGGGFGGSGMGGSGMGESPPSAGIEVPAELLSSNPAVVTVTENAVSPLNFIFRVQNELLETGSGALRLAIEVIDEGFTPPPQCTDSFEPNNSVEEASSIVPGDLVEATLCEGDLDNFTFTPPVAEGDGFTVKVGFSGEAGFFDAVLLNSEGLFSGFGVSTLEGVEVGGVADGGAFVVQTSAFLFFEPEISYTLDVVAGPNAGENQCCESSPFPGCAEVEVEQCVCELDLFCCEVAYDELCVQLGFQCGTSCAQQDATSDCCTATDEPGCTNPEVNSCICQVDSTCCTGSFDEACVTQAIAECGAQCAVAEPESDCCSASGAPGCTVPSVESCVCEIDSFCCLGSFDENCAALAASQCDVQCGE